MKRIKTKHKIILSTLISLPKLLASNCPVGLIGANCDTDINECQLQPNHCAHTCVNVHGSFRCTCKNNFVLGEDGRSCRYVVPMDNAIYPAILDPNMNNIRIPINNQHNINSQVSINNARRNLTNDRFLSGLDSNLFQNSDFQNSNFQNPSSNPQISPSSKSSNPLESHKPPTTQILYQPSIDDFTNFQAGDYLYTQSSNCSLEPEDQKRVWYNKMRPVLEKSLRNIKLERRLVIVKPEHVDRIIINTIQRSLLRKHSQVHNQKEITGRHKYVSFTESIMNDIALVFSVDRKILYWINIFPKERRFTIERVKLHSSDKTQIPFKKKIKSRTILKKDHALFDDTLENEDIDSNGVCYLDNSQFEVTVLKSSKFFITLRLNKTITKIRGVKDRNNYSAFKLQFTPTTSNSELFGSATI